VTNVIKVMIVDDEILAVKHLESLIPWSEHGFEIVAETTYPQHALELFGRHRPQIIFADIKMPGMDGLEFSKAVLQTGIPVHIVLLTSYKEFDYAKEAVKIGVFDYLLKHELHPDELIAVLRRIRGELDIREQKEGVIRRQLFYDLLKGLELNGEQTNMLSKESKRRGNQFIFILMGSNAPVPVIPSLLPEPRNEPILWNELPADSGFYCLDALPLDRQQWGLILAVSRPCGYSQARIEIVATVRYLQRTFKTRRGESASVTISPFFHELSDIHRMYVCCERALKHAPFFEQQTIIEPDAIPLKSDNLETEIKTCVIRAAGQLERHEAEQVCLTIDEAFTFVIKRLHMDAALHLCRELIVLLESFRTERRLGGLVEQLRKEGETGENWVTFAGISKWFQRLFREAVHEAEEKRSNRYSWRVKRTLDLIREKYYEALTVEQLAEEVGISGDRLRHLFKQETGITVLDYLTQIRMEHAKRMLKDKRFKVYEVADKVGYKNSQYFSQVFRKTVGVNPLVYAEGERAADEMEN